jgi:hypothetical protein
MHDPAMTGTPTADPDVFNNSEERRYEIVFGSHLAGLAAYTSSEGNIVFTHTEIDPSFEGKGLGGRLAKAALDDARHQGKTVTPLCHFIAGYIRRHPEYEDLVVDYDTGARPP